MSPHTYRFCCNYDMDGEMLTVMRTDKESLRLFEIETLGMVSKSKVLTNNNCEKKNHSFHDLGHLLIDSYFFRIQTFQSLEMIYF